MVAGTGKGLQIEEDDTWQRRGTSKMNTSYYLIGSEKKAFNSVGAHSKSDIKAEKLFIVQVQM